MIKFPTVNEQMDMIKQGVDEIIPTDDLVPKIEKSIKTGDPLIVKMGCDPSMPDLHIGHAVVLRKMRHFQDLGHQVILIIGDFTAMIGDPSGRNKTRPQLTQEETRKFGQSYVDQSSIILDVKKLKIVYNSDWLGKMNFNDVIRLASHYTVARMLERNDFEKRYKNEIPISIHEFLYPLAQGMDSVELKADVELGGTDQKFNLLVGRELQRDYNQKPQTVITTPLIEGTDGVKKMSKSYHNYIGLTESPEEMYGKVLSIPDGLIGTYFEFAVEISKEKLYKIKMQLTDETVNPRDLKRELARKIVSLYHSRDDARIAEVEFDKIFIKKEIPDDIPEFKIEQQPIKLVQLIVDSKLALSKGEAKRLILQGAVILDDEKIGDINYEINSDGESILKVGKRRFIKIIC